MKSKAVKSLVCAALMAMALSMTACGDSKADVKGEAVMTEEEAPADEETPAEDETPAEEETPAEDEVSDDASTGGRTLEDYLNEAPDEKKQLEDQIAAQAQEGVSIAIDVKGNDFTYIYTIEDASQITDEMKQSISEGLDTMAAAFEMIAKTMDAAIGEEGAVTVNVRYQDADGNVIEEKGFKAGE